MFPFSKNSISGQDQPVDGTIACIRRLARGADGTAIFAIPRITRAVIATKARTIAATSPVALLKALFSNARQIGRLSGPGGPVAGMSITANLPVTVRLLPRA
jgi:hypothetical protein